MLARRAQQLAHSTLKDLPKVLPLPPCSFSTSLRIKAPKFQASDLKCNHLAVCRTFKGRVQGTIWEEGVRACKMEVLGERAEMGAMLREGTIKRGPLSPTWKRCTISSRTMDTRRTIVHALKISSSRPYLAVASKCRYKCRLSRDREIGG